LADRIRRARKSLEARGFGAVEQRHVAEAMGVSAQTVSSWETTDRETSLLTLQRLAQVLQVDRDWLLFGPRPGETMQDVPPAPDWQLRDAAAIPKSESPPLEQVPPSLFRPLARGQPATPPGDGPEGQDPPHQAAATGGRKPRHGPSRGGA
jgi:transcriptional regulator with XRE-family HTH domain